MRSHGRAGTTFAETVAWITKRCMIKTMLSSRKTRSGNKTRGQTLVEVTLIIPFLITLVGAAVDWGMVFFVSHVVQNAVRSGARLAVTQVTPLSATTVKTEVRRVIPDTPLFSGFRDTATIQVTCVAGTPPFLKVQTTGVVNFYFMRLLGLSTITLTRDATMKYERNLTACPTIT